jgi:cullin 3
MEKLMIAKLKNECGYQFTSKLEGMFVDLSLSQQVNSDYQQSIYKQEALIHHFEIMILTTGFWPFQPPQQSYNNNNNNSTENNTSNNNNNNNSTNNNNTNTMYTLPSNMIPHGVKLPYPLYQTCLQFTTFYIEKYNGRKLTWCHNLGQADIKGYFDNHTIKEFSVSTYQLMIMILFNQQASYTMDELRQLTMIPDIELKRHVLSLCTPKCRIFNKASKTKVNKIK